MSLGLGLLVVVLLGCTASLLYALHAVRPIEAPQKPDRYPGDAADQRLALDAHTGLRLDGIDRDLAALVLAVSDGIARTDRAEKRIRKTVTSAKRLLAESGLEHAALEAEHDELREPDDEALQEVPLLALSPPVARGRTGIPGLSPETLEDFERSRDAG